MQLLHTIGGKKKRKDKTSCFIHKEMDSLTFCTVSNHKMFDGKSLHLYICAAELISVIVNSAQTSVQSKTEIHYSKSSLPIIKEPALSMPLTLKISMNARLQWASSRIHVTISVNLNMLRRSKHAFNMLTCPKGRAPTSCNNSNLSKQVDIFFKHQ